MTPWTSQPQSIGALSSEWSKLNPTFLVSGASGTVDILNPTNSVSAASVGASVLGKSVVSSGGVYPIYGQSARYNAPLRTIVAYVVPDAGLPGAGSTRIYSDFYPTSGNYSFVLGFETTGISLFCHNGSTSGSAVWTTTVTVGVPLALVGTYDGATIKLFCNGRLVASGAFTGSLRATTDGVAIGGNPLGLAQNQDLRASLVAVAAQPASYAYALALCRNPWQLFAPLRRPWLVAQAPASVTAYYPGSDISVAGWTSSSSGSLYADIDDVALDRGDYITSPDLSTSATFGWKDSNGSPATIPAGSWSVDLDASYFLGASGQVRLVWLDAGGSSVGATSWQTLTGTDTSYNLSITTTGPSTQFRYEVAP